MSNPDSLSFLPDGYLQRKAQRRTNVVCTVLFTLVAGAIAAAFVWTERAMEQIEKKHAAVESEYTEAARRIAQVQELQAKQRQMAHQAELAASLLERVPRSFLLAEVTNAMPAGVSLLDWSLESRRRTAPAPVHRTAFEQQQAKLSGRSDATVSAQPVVYDVSMKMTGVAMTDVQVAQFMRALGRSELLRDVNLVITDRHNLGDRQVRRFQIEMTMNPDADVQLLEAR